MTESLVETEDAFKPRTGDDRSRYESILPKNICQGGFRLTDRFRPIDIPAFFFLFPVPLSVANRRQDRIVRRDWIRIFP